MTRRTHGFAVIAMISAWTPGQAGLPAGQRHGELVQLLRGLGEGGAAEPGGLAIVQFRGMGEDGAALRAVGGPAGVEGGQPAEPVPVHGRAPGGGQRGEVRAVAGGHGPDEVQSRGREVSEVRLAVLPGVEHDGHVRGVRRQACRGADRLVPGLQLVDHDRELGDVRAVAGIRVPGQRQPAVSRHRRQPDEPQVRALLLALSRAARPEPARSLWR